MQTSQRSQRTEAASAADPTSMISEDVLDMNGEVRNVRKNVVEAKMNFMRVWYREFKVGQIFSPTAFMVNVRELEKTELGNI